MANDDRTYRIFFETLGIDPASLNGGGGGGGGGGAVADNGGTKKVLTELKKGNKGARKGLGATLGIKFGIASLLKQSQVFTGFVGTIFQLMGALVDVILAPFLPILIPGIRLIADLIPHVAKYSQAIFDFLDRTLFSVFRNLGIPEWIDENVKKALSAILVGVVLLKITGLWNPFKSLVSTFFTKPIWALLSKMFPQIDTLVGFFKGTAVVDIMQSAGRAVLNAIIKPMWDKALTVLDAVSGFIKAPFKALWGAIQIGLRAEGDTLAAKVISLLSLLPFAKTIREFPTTLLNNIDLVKVWLKGTMDSIIDFPAMLGRKFNTLIDWFVNLKIYKTIQDLPLMLQTLWNDLPRLIGDLPVVGAIMKWVGKELLGKLGKLGGLFKGAVGLAKKGFGGATKLADPGRGLLGKFMPEPLLALGSKLSPNMLKKAALGFKALPVVGAVFEAGFGAYATYKDFKKYGPKAAAGRFALTVANTTAALFDPTGVSSAVGSIATNIAMDKAYAKWIDPKESWKRDNPDIWVQNPNPLTGVMEWNKVQTKKNDQDAQSGVSMPADRSPLDAWQ